MSGRWLHALMCDDVRSEMGNKLSYMGIYGPSLLLPSFPAVLPKLCFVLTASGPAAEPGPRALAFRLMRDDEVIGELRIDSADLEAHESVLENVDSKRRVFRGVLALYPFQLDSPCSLRIRAQWDDEELKGGTWSVGLQS